MVRVTAHETRTTTSSGLDLSYVTADVRPQDDLYRHVNGRWLDVHEIPADRAVDGAFYTLRDDAEIKVRAILENSSARGEGGDAALIGDLYASFLDTDTIEKLDTAPLEPLLTEIAEASDTAALQRVLGSLQRRGLSGLVGYYVDTDSKASDEYRVHLQQSGLGLPDESYYREEKYAEIRKQYTAHVGRILELAGLDAGDAEQIVELETAIAQGHWDVVARRDAEKSYNPRTAEEIAATGFDIAAWREGLADGGALDRVIVGQPSFLEHVAGLLATRPIEQWRAWASCRLIHALAPYLTADIVAENFAFYGTTLSGAPENRERWKRGVSFVESAAGFAVGRIYTERHFPPAAKEQMSQLVDNLIEAYRRNISDLPWMTPATREKALAKLATFTPKIGYPAAWRDYSTLHADRADLVGNVLRAGVYEHERELAKIGRPVDRDEWFMTPQTVNAYYNPGMNEIVFPAAILQPPFFSPDADAAVNYGAIGAVIGHEIGHGFDDQGARYDGAGELVNWWTEEDETAFRARTGKLIAQYDAFTPAGLDAEKYHVNGGFTIGENVGDLGGLSIGLAAYEISLDGAEPPLVDGLTGLQRVFFSWATVWRTQIRDEEAIRRLAIDPHSPAEFRCNGVLSNIDAFYDAFAVTESDALYLEPEERVRIW